MVQEWLTFVANLDFAYKVFNNYILAEREAANMYITLRKHDLLGKDGDPTRSLGSALALADAYGMTITKFTSEQCIALIFQYQWVRDMRDIEKSRVIIECKDQNGEDMLAIGGVGDNVQLAVCRCLYNAFMAGVVDKL